MAKRFTAKFSTYLERRDKSEKENPAKERSSITKNKQRNREKAFKSEELKLVKNQNEINSLKKKEQRE